MTRTVVAVALTALVFAPGCSLVFIDAPARPLPDEGPVECAASSMLPLVDATGFAAATVVSLLTVAAASIGGPDREGARVAAGLAAGGGAFGLSAAYGLYQTERCRNANALGAASAREPGE